MHRTGPAVSFLSVDRRSVPARPVIGPTLSRMADMTGDDPYFFETLSYPYLYVFWKQSAPSPSEVAALHRIDPGSVCKSLAEVAARLKDEDFWRLGPFAQEDEANVMEEQLRSCKCFSSVEKKWQ